MTVHGHPASPARRRWLRAATAALALPAWLATGGCTTRPGLGTPVRVAAVGRLSLCGVWPRMAEAAATALGQPVHTAAAAPKEGVVPAFAHGEAALLLIHASDEAASLEAAGLAGPPRVWGWNEHVLVGPAHDPAGVHGAPDGTEALRRIAAAQAPFIALRDAGSYGIVQRLWRRGGVRPDARWLRADTSASPQAVLRQAAEQQAYAVVGHIPLRFGKMGAPGIERLLQGDPLMRRPYVVLTPGPRHPADRDARTAAERLAAYLLSGAGQAALAEANTATGGPWVFARDSVVPWLDGA